MCKSDAELIVCGNQLLRFLFDNYALELADFSVEAIDLVNYMLHFHVNDLSVGASCVAFLEVTAVRDNHLIVLSSSEKGLGFYCDLLMKFMVNI